MRAPITITITITDQIWPDYYYYYYSGILRSLLLLLLLLCHKYVITITITISNILTTVVGQCESVLVSLYYVDRDAGCWVTFIEDLYSTVSLLF